jgi:hypothetical protein
MLARPIRAARFVTVAKQGLALGGIGVGLNWKQPAVTRSESAAKLGSGGLISSRN